MAGRNAFAIMKFTQACTPIQAATPNSTNILKRVPTCRERWSKRHTIPPMTPSTAREPSRPNSSPMVAMMKSVVVAGMMCFDRPAPGPTPKAPPFAYPSSDWTVW